MTGCPPDRRVRWVYLWVGLLCGIASTVHTAELNIPDGIVVKFGADAGIVVRDGLRAGANVTFTGLRDDTAGGQTGEQAQTPAPGEWRGLQIEASAPAHALRLDDGTIRYAGAQGGAALILRNTSPSIVGLRLSDSLLGARITAGAAPAFTSLLLEQNAVGMEVDGARPTLTRSILQNNAGGALINRTPSTVLSATNNWWGHISGPHDPISNPTGQGNSVSAGVDYAAWLTAVPLLNPKITVANNQYVTNAATVTLTLSCRNATEYRVAENGNFSGLPFVPMTSRVDFTLSPGQGHKTISAQFRTASGSTATANLPQPVLYDTAGPVINVVNPIAGSVITESTAIRANVSDPAGVQRVEFYIDDLLVATNLTAPYNYTWDVTPFEDGEYRIKLVAYDKLSQSSTDTRLITLRKAPPPPPDTTGPSLTDLKYDGTALIDGITLTRSGPFTLVATDQSGVSRIEFVLDDIVFANVTSGTSQFSAALDLNNVADGAHLLTINAFDSRNQTTVVNFNIQVVLAPPPAPVIRRPDNGSTTSQADISLVGSAEKNTNVTVYVNGTPLPQPVPVDSQGGFSTSVTLANGENRLQAAARNRGGNGPLSDAVVVTRDTSVPAAPIGLVAQSLSERRIRLSWAAGSAITQTYNVYRAANAFDAVAGAIKVNQRPLGTPSFDDVLAQDGTYYYRVEAVNAANVISGPSNQAFATADGTPPVAVRIAYAPQGKTDTVTGRIASGRVEITLDVSEALLTDPFLSISPNNGIPSTVPLNRVSDTVYRGVWEITPAMPAGTAYAVFSARDLVGNRGTEITQGGRVEIDATGPALSALTITPAEPIKNDTAQPATIDILAKLSEPLKPGTRMELSYHLTQSASTPIVIDSVSAVDNLTWQGRFSLPATAGAAGVELLQFAYRGLDDLDNVSTQILAKSAFQVYQGELPPTDVPRGLQAKALPAGRVLLNWQAVEGANGYVLFRRGPGESVLTQRIKLGVVGEYNDDTAADGRYEYALASLRNANGQETLSTLTAPVTVDADATRPEAPRTLTLTLLGAGIKAQWQAANAIDTVRYNLYRAAVNTIVDVGGLTPLQRGIDALFAVDGSPSLTEHAYAVTAVDAAGNESLPSNSVYLNVELLPVATFTIVQDEQSLPVLSWTHTALDVAGYKLFLGPKANGVSLGGGLLKTTQYIDAGFAGEERLYSLVAVDPNQVESVERTLMLPKVAWTLAAGTLVQRGVMNSLRFTVTNESSQALTHAQIVVDLQGRRHVSALFTLAAGETATVPVVVGGYADLQATQAYKATLRMTPNAGEEVRISRAGTLPVRDGALVLNIESGSLTRGGAGDVVFSVENTSDAELELITATQTGRAASSEVSLDLLDADGNVLQAQPMHQALGANVITLATGTTITRIAPGVKFASAPIRINVPVNAPDDVILRLSIAQFHYHLGKEDHVAIQGGQTRRNARLVDAPYGCELDAPSPAVSIGDEEIVLTGRVVNNRGRESVAAANLKLILNMRGFERSLDVVTDATGSFTHRYQPSTGDSGLVKVSCIHPERVDRPQQREFILQGATLTPTPFRLSIPTNADFTIPYRVGVAAGTSATNLRLEYRASDQTGGVLPEGVSLTLPAPRTLANGAAETFSVIVHAQAGSASSGALILALLSDESNGKPLQQARIDYEFSAAVPNLTVTPGFIETGVAYDSSISETVALANKGFADMTNVQVALLNEFGSPAPQWAYLTSPASLGTLAIGASRSVDIVATPTQTVPEGVHRFKLRITSDNHPVRDFNVFVAVTQSGVGGALFKVSDIYTATRDANGNLIPGLAGAKIRLTHEEIGTLTRTLTADAQGEAFVNDLPPGGYNFRVSADKHQDAGGRLRIKPGVTLAQDVFIDYTVIKVDWSVREIALTDRYEITLNATYETDVPTAVVVIEPASTNLPKMNAGDVLHGELTLVNHGLVRADNVRLRLPASNEYLRYELLADAVPATLEAKARSVVPYRVIALKSFDPGADGAASGGACISISACSGVDYDTTCANGSTASRSTPSCVYFTGGQCGGSGGGGGGGFGGGSGGGGGSDVGTNDSQLQGLPSCRATPDNEPCGGSGNGAGSD